MLQSLGGSPESPTNQRAIQVQLFAVAFQLKNFHGTGRRLAGRSCVEDFNLKLKFDFIPKQAAHEMKFSHWKRITNAIERTLLMPVLPNDLEEQAKFDNYLLQISSILKKHFQNRQEKNYENLREGEHTLANDTETSNVFWRCLVDPLSLSLSASDLL